MKKFDPYDLPARQIWTDTDLAKFCAIAFILGLIIGVIL